MMRDPVFEAGEVAIARVRNPLEDPNASGKPRPVVLLHRYNGRWNVMGLTSKASRSDGTPRDPVPDTEAVGLTGPGYLWGRPVLIDAPDVLSHVGWVDPLLAALIIERVPLSKTQVAMIVRSMSAAA
jgi:hypothetical protein